MSDEKEWLQHAQLVLKGLENAEAQGKEHAKEITKLQVAVGNLQTLVKILTAIAIPLVIQLLSNVTTYLGGR